MMFDTLGDPDMPDDDASMYQDVKYWKWSHETAAAQDRLDEAAEDYRRELAEYHGIANASRAFDAD